MCVIRLANEGMGYVTKACRLAEATSTGTSQPRAAWSPSHVKVAAAAEAASGRCDLPSVDCHQAPDMTLDLPRTKQKNSQQPTNRLEVITGETDQ